MYRLSGDHPRGLRRVLSLKSYGAEDVKGLVLAIYDMSSESVPHFKPVPVSRKRSAKVLVHESSDVRSRRVNHIEQKKYRYKYKQGLSMQAYCKCEQTWD